MAIKTISKLDPYENNVDEQCIGGNIYLCKMQNANDAVPAISDPQSQGKSHSPDFNLKEEDNYFNLLFEVSKPLESGTPGLASTEFESYKLTYQDLIKNVIVDTKQYLNSRNNLGDYDLCAITNLDYSFFGNKTFRNNVEISGTLGVKGDTHLDSKLNVLGFADFYNSMLVRQNLTCNNNIDAGGHLSAKGALYTATLTSDANGTTVNPGKNGFVVSGVLTATTSKVTIQQPVKMNSTLDVDGRITGNSGLTITASGATITGDSTFNNSVTIKQNLTVNGTTNLIGKTTAGDLQVTNLTCTNPANLTAMHAFWSDLAEYYLADAQYEPGTLVKFGGENEVTVADAANGEANAIVTSKPAFLMNSGLKDNPLGCAIALAGRVPVKVVGPVRKFDRIVLSDVDGVAKAISPRDKLLARSKVLGRALQASDEEGIKLIECVVKFDL